MTLYVDPDQQTGEPSLATLADAVGKIADLEAGVVRIHSLKLEKDRARRRGGLAPSTTAELAAAWNELGV